MTNVCHICKFNCHINCQENKSFCKSIQLGFDGFKCKICPNKCKLDSHEKVPYQYPTYEYKTIDNILKLYIQNKKIFASSDSKIEYIIKKKEEEIKNFQDIFISDNNKLEKQINIKKEIFKQLNIEKNNSENIILTKTDRIKNIDEKIINEANTFDNFIFNITSDNMKFHDILLMSLINNYINKEYYRELSEGCGGGRCLIF